MVFITKQLTKGHSIAMNRIPHSGRYLPHTIDTRYYSVKLYRGGCSVNFVCRKYHISKASLMRWNKRFDGTKDSLRDKFHRPISPHPNAHTEMELKWINDLLDRFCEGIGIEHKLIRPRTPWHNGKVERSYRNDQERFYNFLSFYSFNDLKEQMYRYMRHSNLIPMAVPGWISPIDRRSHLEVQRLYRIRYHSLL